jgi:hypothetical protein
MSRAGTAARTAAIVGVTSVGVLGAAATGLAAYFTRRVVTPDHVRPDDVWVVDVDDSRTPPTVTLQSTPETVAPGRYGLWFDGRVGHARLGEPSYADDEVVVRPVEQVDSGVLRSGPARWNGYYYSGTPTSALGLDHEDVEVPTDLGPMRAWLVPAAGADAGRTWAVLVHGRGATREECLRAVRPMHDLGLSVLVVSYRNDAESPSDPSGRYHLGDNEWRDVEAAMLWAVEHGARDLVLLGWSMGGAIVLQAATRSWLSDRVRAVVLDGPVVDWHAVLDHQSGVNHLPRQVTRLGHGMLRHPLGLRVIGLREPLDLRRLDWVTRAAELALPVLLIHSDGDEYVPNGASKALARARPDLVTLEPWRDGRHTKEWNTDPDRWDAVVAGFVGNHLR